MATAKKKSKKSTAKRAAPKKRAKKSAAKRPAKKTAKKAAKKRARKHPAKKRATKRNPAKKASKRRAPRTPQQKKAAAAIARAENIRVLAEKVMRLGELVSREKDHLASGPHKPRGSAKLRKLKAQLHRAELALYTAVGKNQEIRANPAKKAKPHKTPGKALAAANRKIHAIEKKQGSQERRLAKVEKAQVIVKKSALDKINTIKGLRAERF